MLRSLFVAAALVLTALASASSASAAPPPLGGISMFDPPSCFTYSDEPGCTQDDRIGNQHSVVSTDDRVYLSGTRLFVYERKPDGSLGAVVDCVAQVATADCPQADP